MTPHEEKLRRKATIWTKNSGVFDQKAFFDGHGMAKDYYEKKDREREKEECEARARRKQEVDDAAMRVAAGKIPKSRGNIRRFVSEKTIQRLHRSQHDHCAVCGKKLYNKFYVDHDHVTNAVRGLLCLQCNVMLGMAHDDADVLSSGARYIRKTDRQASSKSRPELDLLFTN